MRLTRRLAGLCACCLLAGCGSSDPGPPILVPRTKAIPARAPSTVRRLELGLAASGAELRVGDVQAATLTVSLK